MSDEFVRLARMLGCTEDTLEKALAGLGLTAAVVLAVWPNPREPGPGGLVRGIAKQFWSLRRLLGF